MSLDRSKLEKVVELASGALRARCPACAETGGDRSGEHLLIYPDGKFGCCAHQGDAGHRKRIYALVGERVRRTIKVRVVAEPVGTVRAGILGRLGQSFRMPARKATEPDAPDGWNEVETNSERRTPRTGEVKSDSDSVAACPLPRTGRTEERDSEDDDELPFHYSRTLRTPQYSLHVTTKSLEAENTVNMYKEYGEGVRCVRQGEVAVEPPKPAAEALPRLPCFTPDGTLVIPFDSPEQFHWWKGGQALAETRAEVESWRREAAGKEQHGVGV